MRNVSVKVTSVRQLNKVAKKCLSVNLLYVGLYSDTIHTSPDSNSHIWTYKRGLEQYGELFVLVYKNRYSVHNHDGGLKQVEAEMFLHKPSKRKTRIKRWRN